MNALRGLPASWCPRRIDPASLDARQADAQLVPEIILPVQFEELRRSGAGRPPEHGLMFAVLEDAVRCYQAARDVRNQQLLRETEAWFASEAADSPFSFVTICQVLGFDPTYLRDGLRRWRARRRMLAPGSRASCIRWVAGSRHRVTTNRRKPGLTGMEPTSPHRREGYGSEPAVSCVGPAPSRTEALKGRRFDVPPGRIAVRGRRRRCVTRPHAYRDYGLTSRGRGGRGASFRGVD